MIKKQCLSLFCAICLFVLLFSLSGCGKNTKPAKTNDVDFTVVSAGDVPEELNKLIKERKKNPFELTFSDNASLYIVKGYGKQPTGGYSITVNDFYQSNDDLVFDTELFGPKKDDAFSTLPSYPYIIIKTEFRENPVVFR